MHESHLPRHAEHPLQSSQVHLPLHEYVLLLQYRRHLGASGSSAKIWVLPNRSVALIEFVFVDEENRIGQEETVTKGQNCYQLGKGAASSKRWKGVSSE